MAYNASTFEDALPWSKSEYDRRFVGIASVAFVVGNILFFVLAFIAAFFNPTVDESELQLDQERFVKLVIERQAQPKPEIKKPEKKKPEPKKPESKPEPKKAEKQPPPKKPEPTAQQRTEAARKKAESSGLMAMQDELADLRQSFSTEAIKNQKPTSNSGAASNIASDNTAAVIASRAGQGSGGINAGTLGRSTGGDNLAGRNTTAVKSTINSAGGGVGGGGGSARSRGQEEVELMFQKNRGAIDIIYNRALRANPGLRGKLVLEIIIAPNGSVTNVRILSSELHDTELENKIITRVKLFKFETRNNIDTTTVKYPIDFLPS
jgi:periplasmic protein TonB